MILVDFPDKLHTKSREEIHSAIFDTMAKYFQEVSYGKITVVGNTTQWLRLSNSITFYGQDLGDEIDHNRDQLIWDASRAAAPYVNFANFKHVMVVHAGYGQESSGVTSDIWSSHRFGLRVEVGGFYINEASITPEAQANGFNPFGVYAHEFAHGFGLPDLYNTDDKKDFVGRWDLMGRGNANGKPTGSSPAHPSAWTKIKLGWVTQTKKVYEGVFSAVLLAPLEVKVVPPAYHAVILPTSEDAYYLIEAREQIGYDKALPSSGVLISFINDKITNGQGVIKIADANPSTPTISDAPFKVGQVFNDTSRGIFIKVLAFNSTGYAVGVDRRGPQPDLAIQSIQLSPAAPKPKQKASVLVNVRNQGNAPSNETLVEVLMDGKSIGQYRVPKLAPGSGTTITIAWNATGGSHAVKAVVDPMQRMTEFDRTNKELIRAFTVGFSLRVSVDAILMLQTPPGNMSILLDGSPVAVDTAGIAEIAAVGGEHELEAPTLVSVGSGTRMLFEAWSDGEKSTKRRLKLNDDVSLSAKYRVQNLLAVEGAEGCVQGGGWHDMNSVINLTVQPQCKVVDKKSRLVFTQWSGDVENNLETASLTMDMPHRVRANWKTQFYLDAKSSYGRVAGAGWYDQGFKATVTVTSPVYVSEDVRHVFVSWVGNATSAASPALSISMDGPKSLQAQWKAQYKLSFKLSGTPPESVLSVVINGATHNQTSEQVHTDWLDAGSQTKVDLNPATVRTFWNQFTFSHLENSAGKKLPNPFPVSAPDTVTAVFNKKFCIFNLCFMTSMPQVFQEIEAIGTKP